MIYISFYFYIFVILMLILYYILPLRTRWLVLFFANIIFYWTIYRIGWQIISLTVILSYVAGLLINKFSYSINAKRIILTIAIILTISPWFTVKQANYYSEIIFHRFPYSPIVPLGISFYTLQIISYLVDIYWGKILPQKNIIKYALFITFFPQIVQGPIPRYETLSIQLFGSHKFQEEGFVKGICLIIWGFFLKLVISDKAAIVVDRIFNYIEQYEGLFFWIAGILYSIQLYTDFLACTTISQGVSRLFGIQLGENFARPYFAVSIKDFWRRWHISFSSWLRDYLYIPLGGNRKGKSRKYINLLLTFLISGFWHGPGMKYIIWGLLHAVYQIIGDITQNVRKKAWDILRLNQFPHIKKIFQQIITFMLVMIAWIIFRANYFRSDALRIFKSMITVFNPWIFFDDSLLELGLSWKEWGVLLVAIYLLLHVSRLHEQGIAIIDKFLKFPLIIRWAIYIFSIISIMTFGTYGFGFNAQDFIYGGF